MPPRPRKKRWNCSAVSSRLDALSNGDGGMHPAVIVVTTPGGREASLLQASSVRAVLHRPFRIEELAEVVTTVCDGN